MYSIRRLLTTTFLLLGVLMALNAENVVTVTGSDGAPGQQATIAVALKTDAADVVAAEIRVPLPEGVEPVEGSLVLDKGRVPDHSVTADMNGRDYVIVLFNTSLKAIPAGDGNLLSFKVALGENPGHYDLSPKVKLSSRSGSGITSRTTGNTLSVLAPRMELGTVSVDFGRVAIRSEVVQQVEVRNSGTTPLEITDYTTGVEGLTAVMPRSIGEGESSWIELHYSPTVRSAGVDDRFLPVSNGVGRSQFVRIQSVPFSVNEVHVGSATGVSDDEVTVSVSMNNMEPITGVDFSVALPDELEFVEGSVTKGARASGLSVESSVVADHNMRIVMYGFNGKAVEGDDGELFSFRLRLKGRSGYYPLIPSKAILANASGENMTSEVYGGGVTISSPSLSASSDWAIGNVPLSGRNVFNYPLQNNSNVPLTIENVVFVDDVAKCVTSMPMVVNPYEGGEISVSVKNPRFGEFASTMNIYSNDPDNRMKSVRLTGNFYSPNEMSFAGRYADGKFLIDASLTNEEAIAALQLDVVCPDGLITDEALLTLSERASGHSATLAKVGGDRYRIVIFSLRNAPFAGNDGVVFSLGLEGTAPAGKQIRIENIKLSSVDGVNITTPNTEVQLGSLPVPVASITLSQSDATMRVGGELKLSATVAPATASVSELKWMSSDSKIVSVDSDGKVTAVALGKAVITVAATDGSGVSAECEITVESTPAESVKLSQTTAQLKVGESVSLTATVLPDDATDKSVTWTSSNVSIATVDANGKVTAVGLGEAVITAQCGEAKATCVVNVVPTPAESVKLSQTSAQLKVGESVSLTATVLPEDATDKSVTWTSSNVSIATVDANGKVTAVGLGEATVTAQCGEVRATCVVKVVPTPAESVKLSQTTAQVKVGESVSLTATVLPDDATDKRVTWTSSNVSIATVDANGKVTAVGLGEAVITAQCGEPKAACAVKVVPTPAESVKLSQTTAQLKVGESVTLTATVLPEDATDKSVTWTSSNVSIATVDANGKVTAVSIGEVDIMASCGDVSATCEVSVLPIIVESIIVTPEVWSGIAGECIQLNANVYPEDATDKSLTWTSSDLTVAVVDGTGMVTLKAEGTCVITATANDESGVEAQCVVTGMSGIEEIFADSDITVDVYDIRGVLLRRGCCKSDLRQLGTGAYILRQGNRAVKVVLK